MGYVLKALLTELANPLAVLNPQVITLSAYFSLREPFFFFFAWSNRGANGTKWQQSSPGLLLKAEKLRER